MRCQKVRIYPTSTQASIMRKWLKAARYTYNQALRLVKDKKAKPNKVLKKLVVTSRQNDNERIKEMKKSTPADIRVRAVLDLVEAYKTAYAGHQARLRKKTTKKRPKRDKGKRWRRKKRKPFNIKYKSKRVTHDSFGFEEKSINVVEKQLFLFSRQHKFGMREPIRMSESLTFPVQGCCRVQYVYGRWYLLSPYSTVVERHQTTQDIVALDPGVRTFISYYGEQSSGEIGVQHALDSLSKSLRKTKELKDAIQRLTEARSSKVKIKRVKKAWYRSHARTSNLADDLHGKTIKFLLDNYDVVIAPHLNTSWMLSSQSNLSQSTKDRLRFLQHGSFRSRLLMKAHQRGKKVYDLYEHGTSLTCSSCGNAKEKNELGGSKTYNCQLCGNIMDRDINSAKNHMLKFLVGRQSY